MSRPSVFSYFTSRATLPPAALQELVEFILRHRDLVLTGTAHKSFFISKSLMTTPLTQLAVQAVELGKDQNFALMRIPPKTTTIPEVFTFRHLPFDLKQMPPNLAAVFQGIPELKDKIVVDLSPFIRSTGQFSDLTGFQNMVVRDLLARSFTTSPNATWLTPRLSLFIAKIYSMSLGSAIAEWFQLDIRQRGVVSTILAFFMMQQLSSAEAAAQYIRRERKFLYLPENQDIEQIFGLIQQTHETLTLDALDDVYTVINAIGIPRVEVNRRIVVTKVQKWGPDLSTTSLALEYPAYFTYLILLCLSGVKIGLSFRMKAMNMLRDGAEFAEDLRHCVTFLPSL